MICDDEYQIIVKVKFTENAYSIITVRKQESETYTDLKVFSAQIQDTSLVCFKLYICIKHAMATSVVWVARLGVSVATEGDAHVPSLCSRRGDRAVPFVSMAFVCSSKGGTLGPHWG